MDHNSQDENEVKVVEGNALFARNLFGILSSKSDSDNVFFSPISVHAVLAMIHQGATKSTSLALEKALGLPADKKTAALGYQKVLTHLNSAENITLSMANKIYLKDSLELLAKFKKSVGDHFKSEVELIDFLDNENASKIINDWVETQTRNKIKEIIKSSDLTDPRTSLVLINAIYFKGNWIAPFSTELTTSEAFYLNETDKIENVPMMHTRKRLNYGESSELDAQLLEIHYSNQEFSMIFILPSRKDGIRDLEAKLVATSDFSKLFENLRCHEVDVTLPKFKIEQTIDLTEVLSEMGLEVIFDRNSASFPDIVPLKANETLVVSKVLQKSFIEVNEEGAEAAAATVVKMKIKKRCMKGAPPPPKYFVANHPFIALIFAKRRNCLFVGRVCKLI